jgi:hypothetical protein
VPVKPGGRTNNSDLRDIAGARQPTTGPNDSSVVHGLQIGTMVIDKSEVDACAHQGKIVIGLRSGSDQKEVTGSGKSGSELRQQQQGSNLVQEDVVAAGTFSSEPVQQNHSEETLVAVTSTVEVFNKLNMQSSSARISKGVAQHRSSANSSDGVARGMPHANRSLNIQMPMQQNNFNSTGPVFRPRAVALQHRARNLGASGSDRLRRELNQSLSGAREDSHIHKNEECSGCEH